MFLCHRASAERHSCYIQLCCLIFLPTWSGKYTCRTCKLLSDTISNKFAHFIYRLIYIIYMFYPMQFASIPIFNLMLDLLRDSRFSYICSLAVCLVWLFSSVRKTYFADKIHSRGNWQCRELILCNAGSNVIH